MEPSQNVWRDIKNGELVIDVRRADEFATGHIDGAINIPHTEIKKVIADYVTDKERTIVLYCRSGRRSNLALQNLHELGYKDAYNAGGYAELLKQKPD